MRPSLKALENVLVVQPMAVGNSLLYDQTYYYQRQCNYLTADTRMFLCASGIASCLFTSSGEGFFLKSSSEYARFSLSAARLLRPLCKLNLKDGLRTPEGTPQIVVEHYGNYPPPACVCVSITVCMRCFDWPIYDFIDETHPTNNRQSVSLPGDTSVNQSFRSMDMTHDEVTDHTQ